jgi:hypothetical protein
MTLLIVCGLLPSQAFAQDTSESSSLGPFARRVLLDPTTFAPAILTYDATMRDWNSSQPLFQTGLYVEHNPNFTISGRPDDVPLDYATGKRQILKDSFAVFELSLVNNAANAVLERVLTDRMPEHRKRLRVLGTVERIAFAASLTYFEAMPHYRQWQKNTGMASRFAVRLSLPID